MSAIIEHVASLGVGTVESVAPDEIRVILDIDAPQATALNTGVPSRFPRINGFVLIPNETGAVVGLVHWLGVERSAFPKRAGLKDFGLIDLPFPLRKMFVNPVGTLRAVGQGDGAMLFELDRGVAVFPSVGDPVLLPTAAQLNAIVESQGPNRRVPIGTSPVSANATVSVDPDKLFGRHLAVLGNTGSGKSCSVAGLIRWSLDAAVASRDEAGRTSEPNARFIILDPNGEYASAFEDRAEDVRTFHAALFGEEEDSSPGRLIVPAWMWNSHEWSAFTQAAPGYQRPLLLQALRGLRAGSSSDDDAAAKVARTVRGYKSWLDQLLATGASGFGGHWGTKLQCGALLRNVRSDVEALIPEVPQFADVLEGVTTEAGTLEEAKRFDWKGGLAYEPFTEQELVQVRTRLDAAIEQLPTVEITFSASEDAPTAFDVADLPGYLDILAKGEDFASGSQYLHTLVMRIKTMLADPRLAPIVAPQVDLTLEEWLGNYVGQNDATNGQIAIIDLSLVPADVLHLTIAVIARLIFEASQRFRKLNASELPTVLVLEEAHAFVHRRLGDTAEDLGAAALCRETFERIAREGRKFGLGLVLSSQRPSELSPTVLAQCNTFLLHRIVNDADQQLVSHLVPDNLGKLLRELPSLPSRQAILLGWATPIPVLVEMSELPLEQRPHSSDPHFWDVWTGAHSREIDWGRVAADWAP